MRIAIVGFIISVLAITPAAAHEIGSVRPDTLWRSWSFDPSVIIPLVFALWFYGRGLQHLWARAGSGRGVTYVQSSSFALGAAMLFIAVVSPLHSLGEALLSAHMAQHSLLLAVTPPLLLFGKPGLVFAWALPIRWRRDFLQYGTWRSLTQVGDTLSQPRPAAILHGLALWFWHANPELSMQEHRTSGIAAGWLREQGYEVTEGVGGTGVVGVLRNGDGPTVLLRADMDALPIKESTGLSYASQKTGTDRFGQATSIAHSCGHGRDLCTRPITF